VRDTGEHIEPEQIAEARAREFEATTEFGRAAEMTKLLENIHRAVNIDLVNELKVVCDRMGIDIHEVIRAAATKPFGFTPCDPGPGIGEKREFTDASI